MACPIPISAFQGSRHITATRLDPFLLLLVSCPRRSFDPCRRFLYPKAPPRPSTSTSTSSRRATKAPLRAHRENHRPTGGFLEEFSVLPQDGPWDGVDIWATMALYFFSLHVPISYGGLGVIAQVLHQLELDPLTKAVSVLLLESVEFIGTLVFFHCVKKPENGLLGFFQYEAMPKGRNWIKASLVGLAVLFFVATFTSFLAEQLVEHKIVNDLALHEILHNSPAAETICFLVYCIVAPLLEEMVYRGFLLTSLASTMKWQQAVAVNALIFSLAHLSLENTPQLFIVGTVLGCVYCWTGNLASSIVVHSAYNAAILIITGLN